MTAEIDVTTLFKDLCIRKIIGFRGVRVCTDIVQVVVNVRLCCVRYDSISNWLYSLGKVQAFTNFYHI